MIFVVKKAIAQFADGLSISLIEWKLEPGTWIDLPHWIVKFRRVLISTRGYTELWISWLLQRDTWPAVTNRPHAMYFFGKFAILNFLYFVQFESDIYETSCFGWTHCGKSTRLLSSLKFKNVTMIASCAITCKAVANTSWKTCQRFQRDPSKWSPCYWREALW